MLYGANALEKLKVIKCKNCFKKPDDWSDIIYTKWLKYINGCDKQDLIKNTKFSYFKSVTYHFKKHLCYKKIAKVRKDWFRYCKRYDGIKVRDPWLLGLYYADGSKTNNGKLSFFLSYHESKIVAQVIKKVKSIFGKNLYVKVDLVGNMYVIRMHGLDLCNKFPYKQDKKNFAKLWINFTKNEKFKFIAGFIDGDGCCSFEDDIYSIQAYIKCTPFILPAFYKFLKKFGYVSVNRRYCLYISPKIGKLICPLTMKRTIKKEYKGTVDVKTAYCLLSKGYYLRTIAKVMGFDKKTIAIALKRVYGKRCIQRYLDTNTKNSYIRKR